MSTFFYPLFYASFYSFLFSCLYGVLVFPERLKAFASYVFISKGVQLVLGHVKYEIQNHKIYIDRNKHTGVSLSPNDSGGQAYLN
jgi:hypothetical protein